MVMIVREQMFRSGRSKVLKQSQSQSESIMFYSSESKYTELVQYKHTVGKLVTYDSTMDACTNHD